jgi:excisionase family DNA binding protein
MSEVDGVEWPDRATLTIEETAVLLGIGRSSAYEAVRCEELPVLRIGRRLFVPTADLRQKLGVSSAALAPASAASKTESARLDDLFELLAAVVARGIELAHDGGYI